MLGQIGIERRAAFRAGAVMLDHVLQSPETPVVHVRRGDGDIAQRRHGEFSLVAVALRDVVTAKVSEFGIKTVVREGLALKQRPAVAMKTIRAVLLVARIVFGVEQFKSTLLLLREFFPVKQNPVKL